MKVNDIKNDIKNDMIRLWKSRCLPNMYIYGPNIKHINATIMEILKEVYLDLLNEALFIVDTDTELSVLEQFCKTNFIFNKESRSNDYLPRIILIHIHRDTLEENLVHLLEEFFETWDDTCRCIFISSHYHTLPQELSKKLLCFMI